MGNLERNIKEAFAGQDVKTKLVDKDAMWNRLGNTMHTRKGVAAFWRVAAIFLAFLLSAGVFAAFNNRAKQQNEIEKTALENEKLQVIIDSIIAIPAVIQTEIQIVEKEKIVYRNQAQNLEKNKVHESEVSNLNNEIIQLKILVSNTKYDLQMARDSLNLALTEVTNIRSTSTEPSAKSNSIFHVTTEMAKEQLQPVKPEPSPKMKLHLIKIQDNNLKYDTNSTLLKK